MPDTDLAKSVIPLDKPCYNKDMKTLKLVIVCLLLLMLAILAIPGCDTGGDDIVTYPSTNPADYEPGGPWERGEPSPSYPP